MNINYGFKVTLQHSTLGIVILRNVTEIHSGIANIPVRLGPKIAFESNVHGTGATYEIANITEFATSLEYSKAVAF